MPSIALATVMTFDTVPDPTMLPYDSVYTESGMMVTSKSDYSSIGDPLFGNPTNALYFHGTNQYVEFRMVDGSLFDLLSLDFLTNGLTDQRWLETSDSTSVFLPGYTTVTTISFSSPDYSNLEWFRVGTPWYATQVDNITFQSSQVPEPMTLFLMGLGLAGLGFKHCKYKLSELMD